MGNSTPCKIVTPKNFNLKLAYVITSARWPTMQNLVSIGAVGASSYTSDQDQIWGPSWYRQLHFVGCLILPISNPMWLPAAILKRLIWRHNSADDHPITTKFGRQMQNGMPMTIHRSKSKPEIKFQYGGLPFPKTGSSYISAVDWAISTKFGMQIDFHLLKQTPSLNLKPEVHFPVSYTHLTLPTNREV